MSTQNHVIRVKYTELELPAFIEVARNKFKRVTDCTAAELRLESARLAKANGRRRPEAAR